MRDSLEIQIFEYLVKYKSADGSAIYLEIILDKKNEGIFTNEEKILLILMNGFNLEIKKNSFIELLNEKDRYKLKLKMIDNLYLFLLIVKIIKIIYFITI